MADPILNRPPMLSRDIDHGNRGGGGMHNVATKDVAGFMSSADKTTFDRAFSAPVTKTASFSVASSDGWLICNGAASITVTLPSPASSAGRVLELKTIAAQTVVSASSNVVPVAGGGASTAILPATAGAWATLVSDGTSWIIMKKG
jgi:hypothetical protein